MSLKIPYACALPFVNTITAGLLNGAAIRLFKNDLTPINTTVLADFIQADFTGYAAQTLAGWAVAILDANNKGSSTATVNTWTCSGLAVPNTVYGVYIVSAAGALLYAERNPSGGILVNSIGQTYAYTPVFTFHSEF